MTTSVTELIVNGEFKAKETAEFKNHIKNVFDTPNVKSYMVDLTNINTADLTAVNAIATTKRAAQRKGLDLQFKVSKNSELKNLLELTQLQNTVTFN